MSESRPIHQRCKHEPWLLLMKSLQSRARSTCHSRPYTCRKRIPPILILCKNPHFGRLWHNEPRYQWPALHNLHYVRKERRRHNSARENIALGRSARASFKSNVMIYIEPSPPWIVSFFCSCLNGLCGPRLAFLHYSITLT